MYRKDHRHKEALTRGESMRVIKAEDRAYCAGLYEGEGNIFSLIIKDKLKDGTDARPYRAIKLRISMTDREPLDLFDDIMGFGRVDGPTQKGSKHYKPMFCYEITGFERVQFVVCQMWDWLSPRRKEQITLYFNKFKSHKPKYPKIKGGNWNKNK
jgi:hypothetical protein